MRFFGGCSRSHYCSSPAVVTYQFTSLVHQPWSLSSSLVQFISLVHQAWSLPSSLVQFTNYWSSSLAVVTNQFTNLVHQASTSRGHCLVHQFDKLFQFTSLVQQPSSKGQYTSLVHQYSSLVQFTSLVDQSRSLVEFQFTSLVHVGSCVIHTKQDDNKDVGIKVLLHEPVSCLCSDETDFNITLGKSTTTNYSILVNIKKTHRVFEPDASMFTTGTCLCSPETHPQLILLGELLRCTWKQIFTNLI